VVVQTLPDPLDGLRRLLCSIGQILIQVKSGEYNSQNMNINQLQEKLNLLRQQLHRLETVEAEKIRIKRILADMGDDFRENEGAKMVMEDHQFLHLRVANLKKEILEVKRKLLQLRMEDRK
jgi:hypothetical protein